MMSFRFQNITVTSLKQNEREFRVKHYETKANGILIFPHTLPLYLRVIKFYYHHFISESCNFVLHESLSTFFLTSERLYGAMFLVFYIWDFEFTIGTTYCNIDSKYLN